MKCDKLKSLWVYCRDINENVDDEFLKFAPKNGYEELVEKSEVDEAIAELKQKLDEYVLVKLSTQQILQNLLDCGLIKEWYFNGKFNVVLKADDPHLQIKELKQKLESVQASMYADVVDANMENRRLKRALWLARARRAEARKNYWYARSCHEGDDFLVSIDGSPVKYIGCIKRTNYDWLLTWSEVEIKCRAKAEEYK